MTVSTITALDAAASVDALASAVVEHVIGQGFTRCGIYVERAKRLRCLAQRGYSQVHDGVPPGQGVLGRTFARDEVSVIRDIYDDPDYMSVGHAGGSEVCVPLHYRDRVFGVLNIESDATITDPELVALMAVAEEVERHVARLGGPGEESPWQALSRETPDLVAAHDAKEIVELAASRAPALVGMHSCLVRRIETDRVRVVTAGPAAEILERLTAAQLNDIADWTGGAVSVYTHGEPYQAGNDAGLEAMGLRSWIAVPLPGGHPADIMLIVDTDRRACSPTAVQVLEVYASHVHSALRMADAFDELKYRARRDSITGLEHASSFHEALGEIRANPTTGVGLLLVDVDNLKQLNDHSGHAAGDRVLRNLARRLDIAVGSEALFRVGGDEFAVLAPSDSAADTIELGERLRHAARTERATVSVGISFRALDDLRGSRGGENMVTEADLAVQAAKRNGRNRVEVFTEDMGVAILERARLATDLSTAAEKGELRLVYQPLVDIRTNRVLGAEALMRWRSPDRGDVSPGAFIPIAEESGQIEALGDWALREAIRQGEEWDLCANDLKLSVNVSGLQLRPTFVEKVDRLLARSSFAPERLVLELTESGLVDDDRRIDLMHDLRDLGVTVAIDDFGTGYSSLSYLRSLPIDILKIDRSFINELHDTRNAAVARTIIELTQSLDLDCVAEGIETLEQLDQLRTLGCGVVQGYYYAKPMEAEAFPGFISGFAGQAAAA